MVSSSGLWRIHAWTTAHSQVDRWHRLRHRGLGTFLGGVFRTKEPYRTYIRARRESGSGAPTPEGDARLLAALAGDTETLLLHLSLTDLASAPLEVLPHFAPLEHQPALRQGQQLAKCWISKSTELLPDLLRDVWRNFRVEEITRSSSGWLRHFATVAGARVFGIRPAVDGSDFEQIFIWLGSPVGLPQLKLAYQQALDEAAPERSMVDRMPRVIVTGPEATSIADQSVQQEWQVLSEQDVQWAIAQRGTLADNLARAARIRAGRLYYSSFQSSGALPPGSPLFVGRRHELDFISPISAGLLDWPSALIVGARRIGKTSLLNQVLHRARSRDDLFALALDLQGIEPPDRSQLAQRIRSAAELAKIDLSRSASTLEAVLDAIVDQCTPRRPLILINEIDRLNDRDPGSIDILRGYHDLRKARFIMTGHSVIKDLSHHGSPWLHFTRGTHFDGKAVFLGALEPEPARQLVDLLQREPLGFQWGSTEDEQRSTRLLLRHSRFVPWLLQSNLYALIEYMDSIKRDVIYASDVEVMFQRSAKNVLADYFENIDYETIGLSSASYNQPAVRFLLFAMARARYFLGDSPWIAEPRLSTRDPRQISFSSQEVVDEAIRAAEVVASPAAIRAFHSWLKSNPAPLTLNLLTLTLAIESIPGERDRYAFWDHFIPQELHRQRRDSDPTLEDLLRGLARNFESSWITDQAPREQESHDHDR